MRAEAAPSTATVQEASQPIVLAYHAVTPDWHHPLAIHPDRFRRQLESLAERGLRGIRFSAAANVGEEQSAVCITFDDAFASTLEWGVPVLQELGWPATAFAVTGPTSSREPMRWLEPNVSAASDVNLTPMSWSDLEGLSEIGWEIGSHSRTHRLLSQLDGTQLEDELAGSRGEIIGRLGGCTSVSYPWGEVHPRVIAAALQAGYTAASGLAGRFRSSDPMAVPRFAVSGRDDWIRYRLKTSRWFWGLRSTPAWAWLDAARRRQVQP